MAAEQAAEQTVAAVATTAAVAAAEQTAVATAAAVAAKQTTVATTAAMAAAEQAAVAAAATATAVAAEQTGIRFGLRVQQGNSNQSHKNRDSEDQSTIHPRILQQRCLRETSFQISCWPLLCITPRQRPHFLRWGVLTRAAEPKARCDRLPCSFQPDRHRPPWGLSHTSLKHRLRFCTHGKPSAKKQGNPTGRPSCNRHSLLPRMRNLPDKQMRAFVHFISFSTP